jgi:short-subunit dehydrogenase
VAKLTSKANQQTLCFNADISKKMQVQHVVDETSKNIVDHLVN